MEVYIKTPKSLRHCLKEMTIFACLLIVVVMFTSFTMYSIKKSKLTEQKITQDLVLGLKTQLSQLLPTFLLPEQGLGLEFLLKRFKDNEGLEHIQIFEKKSQLPDVFSNCKVNPNAVTNCSSKDLKLSAIIAPLTENNHHYGYLLKAKSNSSADSILGFAQFAGVIMLIIALTFCLIYYMLSRIIARKLPDSLDNLIKWIEAEIKGENNENLKTDFLELEEIKAKVSKIIERYTESRNQAIIGQITSGIMHDIKTPLQSIVSATELSKEQMNNPEKKLKRLENLFNVCDINLPTVNEIIESTLDGNRKIQVDIKATNVKSVVDKSLMLTKQNILSNHIDIETSIPEDLDAFIDPKQFLRVTNNLIKNGIEAAVESKSTPPKLKISAYKTVDNKVKIILEDSGKGFKESPSKALKAFKTTKVRGTGLGLIICQKIVEAHNGIINISNSVELGGARLEIVVPA